MLSAVQVVMTPTEAKRLLSKAILNLDEVKRALDKGMLIIHPSSTTIFMLEELGLRLSQKQIWVCGHISPKGLCMSRGPIDARVEIPEYGPHKYPFDLIIRQGTLLPYDKSALGLALEDATSDDVYVKGVNAIDPEGNVGILIAGQSSGGSMSVVLKKQKEKHFKMVIPAGMEKRIPISIGEASKAAIAAKKAQGIPCSLWRLHGKVVTEVDAFRQLCDVEAVPISAGGICGAEGCTIWALSGEENNVEKA